MSRPPLTTHQREVLRRLRRFAQRTASGWVAGDVLGSPGACTKLVSKGYAERDNARGPRGGEHTLYRPIDEHSHRAVTCSNEGCPREARMAVRTTRSAPADLRITIYPDDRVAPRPAQRYCATHGHQVVSDLLRVVVTPDPPE